MFAWMVSVNIEWIPMEWVTSWFEIGWEKECEGYGCEGDE